MNTSQNTEKTFRSASSRRTFLKATAATAGLGALDISRHAHAAGSDIIKVGMIGCGDRNAGAGAQALAADPGARLVAMCDIFMDRVKAKRELIRSKHPGQVIVDDDHCFTGFDSYKKVIECSDVVLIANAAKFHPLHAMTALRAGRHVFVEKPHGIDPAGIKLMQAACDLAREKNLCVVSGLHSRYHAGFAETIQRIHDGQIGEIVCCEENFLRTPYGNHVRKPGLSELEWQASSQYHFTWLSGDDVVQSLVHNADRARWAMREAVPVKCHGIGGRSTMTSGDYGNVFDHHGVVYEFAGGARVYAFCRTIDGCYNEYSSLVFGSKGKADIMRCRISGEKNWHWEGQTNPYQVEHDKLFAAIRSGKALNNGNYMVASTLMTIMGQISCYTGREVTWEEISKSDFAYAPRPEDCHDGMEPPVKPGPDGTYETYKPGISRLL